MQQNRVKRILAEGGLAVGTHVGGIADPQIVELIGLAGFDAAFIDMEHTSFDLHDVQLAVMAAERVGITPIVRTPGFDPAFILRLLDMGVQGVQVPHVSSAETAREAVKKGAGARLALPLNHAAYPRNAAELKELGAGYTNCAPTPEARLLHSLRAQAAEARKLLGQT